MNRRLIKQIVREFWLQTVIAVSWATYRTWPTSVDNISTFIANFGGAFFLTSWAFGQYMRVSKQQRVEDEFQTVKGGLQKLLSSLERQTQHLIGHTTGGDSIGYFTPAISGSSQIHFIFANGSEYPVFDVFAEWIDLSEPIDPPKGVFWTRHRLVLGTIYPHKALPNVFGFDMSQRNQLRITIFIQTRNRHITQQLRAEKVNGLIKIALKTNSENFNETSIPADFPGYDPTQPDKVFST